MNTLKSALEEGVLPGGGISFLALKNEIGTWSSVNLIGDEFFASQIIMEALQRPYNELFSNANVNRYQISQQLEKYGYPFGYDLTNKKIGNSLETGLLDSAKAIRGILWNSISVVSTMITSE